MAKPDIATWLAEIGLEKYASTFEDAEIDFDTLPDLLEADLRELGLPVGPRRKIWARLERARRPNSTPLQPASEPWTQPAPGQDASAERRHLTVMFVDLVGSTKLATRLDAEDMRDVITGYQNAVAAVVNEHDGFVAKFMGDGVLCYFGWPHANEDDTQRAVRAGLSILETVKNLLTPDGTKLAARVGVATGIVIVGDLIGSGANQEAAVVGETPNLAARLQDAASANQLVVPGETLPLLGTMFELSSIGQKALRGVGKPVEVFVVSGEKAVESRFAARTDGRLTPIVGREREVHQIMEWWAETLSGQGRMMLLSGEAGIGKSRIVRAVIDGINLQEHVRVTYQCSPYHSDSAFHPIIQQLNLSAGFMTDDPDDVRLEKLRTVLGSNDASANAVATLLGIATASDQDGTTTSPDEQRRLMMDAVVDYLVQASLKAPLLLVFEDLHWIDPTSLEFLQKLHTVAEHHRILILATARPSFQHSFSATTPVKWMVLNRLGRAMTYAIVDKLTGGKALPEAILKIIADRTDGVPLFVEELTKAIIESSALEASGNAYLLKGDVRDVAIPKTLHDSLTARLDRLGDVKEIAQIAACIGREFSHRLLVQICKTQETDLKKALDQLIGAELIYQRGVAPRARYVFKHALVRDAAYESLLKSRRKTFHAEILSALEARSDTPPVLLATHAEQAGLVPKAIDLWQAAGAADLARPAYAEAEAHLRRAIELNAPAAASGTPNALEKALDLKVQLSVALAPEKGLWADETIETLEDALRLADQVGQTPHRGDILYGLLLGTYFRGSLESSVARADELNQIANASGDLAQLLVAKRLAAIGRFKMGHFAEARPYLDAAEELCDAVADQDLAARFGHDPVVAVKIYKSLNAIFQGRTRRADEYRAEAERRAHQIAHTNTTCAMLGIAVVCAHAAEDLAAEKRHLQILRPMIEKHSVTASRLWAEVSFALLRMAEGDASAIESYHQAEQAVLDANIRLLIPGNRVVAARRALGLGDVKAAQELADAAERLMNDTGEKSWLAELYRVRAELALNAGAVDKAEEHLLNAVAVAQQQDGHLSHLRAWLDLAELHAHQSRAAQAAQALQKARALLNEGDCPTEFERASLLGRRLEEAA